MRQKSLIRVNVYHDGPTIAIWISVCPAANLWNENSATLRSSFMQRPVVAGIGVYWPRQSSVNHKRIRGYSRRREKGQSLNCHSLTYRESGGYG
jgi:hypothetical protein